MLNKLAHYGGDPLIQVYKQHATVHCNRGDTIYLWYDSWGGTFMNLCFPQLLSFAKNKLISVETMKNTLDWTDLFHTPLSATAWDQL